MSTHRKVDPSTLGWVKSEIDETLKQARVALEAFIENPSDRGQLRFCITHLHQVVGTLLMVELDGAAFIAREVEALAEAVLDEQAPSSPEALEALTRGILMLPEYLARLQYGHPDLPLRHLSLLNELRSARGAAAVAELELFQPDLSIRPAAAPGGRERLGDADYAALARTLRATFQGALLNWLRDSANPEPLRAIAEALDELRARAAAPMLQQLFWVAGGLIEALAEAALEATPERKKHLARLDQQIKRIADGAEKSTLRVSSEALVRAILYDLAQVRAAPPRVAELREAFRLDELVEAAQDAEPERAAPSPEVLQSVASVLEKEVEQAQDMLAAAFDSGKLDAQSLAPLVGLLHKMGGTLDMAGPPAMKELVDEIVDTCTALGDGGFDDAPAAAMPLAQALLVVEGGVRALPRPSEHWRQQAEQAAERLRVLRGGDAMPSAQGIEVSDATLTESEYQQLLGVVAGEIGVNLSRIEEALEGFASHTGQPERLDAIPGQLEQIKGALQILGADRAVELAAFTRRHIEDVRRGALAADASLLDGLAVCVGTLGAYVDGLKAGRRNLDSLVDAALREVQAASENLAAPSRSAPSAAGPVAALKDRLEAWMAAPHDARARAALREALAGVASSASPEARKTPLIVAELARLMDLVADDPDSLSDEARNTLLASWEALAADFVPSSPPEPAEERPAAPPAAPPGRAETPAAAVDRAPPDSPPPASSPAPAEDDFDDEIRQIFIEDAREVLENIAREYEHWRADPSQREPLAELRRGYHTLKGSGRMVGATAIADLAWAVENMLNHVRDGKMEPGPELFELIEQSQAVLPHMVAQLEGRAAPAVDSAGIAARAHALTEGSGEAAPASARSGRGWLPRLDGTLLEIFTNEARGHLATIHGQIAACRAAGARCQVTPGLTRAIHTLQGNARSLGIGMMAEACAEAEHLLHALHAPQLPLLARHLDLLEDFAGAVADLVDAVAAGATAPDGLAERFGDLTRRLRFECDQIVPPDASYAGADDAMDVDPAAMFADPPPAEPAGAPPTFAKTLVPAVEAEPPFQSVESEEVPVDPELLEIFREEAADILNQIERVLRAWRAQPDAMEPVLELKRALHTLKGGARMAGAMKMGHVAHHTESLVMQAENRAVTPDAALFDLLEEAHDLLVTMLDGIARGSVPPQLESLVARLQSFTGQPATAAPAPIEAPGAIPAPEATENEGAPAGEAPLSRDAAPEPAPDPLDAGHARADSRRSAADPPPVSRAPDAPRSEAAEPWPDRRDRPGQIRVNTDLLNNLVNYAGEVSISRSRMEQQIYGFRDNLAELKRSATRFREQLRELEIQSEAQILYRLDKQDPSSNEFDPLEFDRYTRLQTLARSLTESLHDLTTIQLNLGNYVGEAEAVLQQQARLNTELQEGLMRTRMVEFSTQAARLRHILRQTARELGKRAELEVTGGEVQIDRNVLERMIGPFEHMIRNSLDHGIEPEAERLRAGKSAVGRIDIAARQEGNEIVIHFSDDGAGMNAGRIRDKAIERGLIAPDANLSEDELLQFVLLSGFSTATSVTHVSGRGVGMDVVHSEVKQLGGSMAVDTTPGAGTTWIIRLPLTLSITQALMVYVGEQMFAVPIGSVANIIECTPEQLSRVAVGKNPLLSHDDKLYSFMNLANRLGIPPAARSARKVPVLLARSGNREVAIQVDGLGGTREIVIKALGRQLAELKGIAGATIMGDGRVVLILDIPGLWYADDALRVEHHQHRAAAAAPEARERPVVMVVDDSLTVRKVTGKHLQRRGFDVMVAKDGLDAVEQLRSRVPDIMLVDIEMPRMDGYELTGRVRSDAGLKHVPIIMITSRAGDKHRQRGLDLGVDIYMTKPYQEDELFGNIDRLLASGRRA